MTSNASLSESTGAPAVLLVGPERWLHRVEPTVEEVLSRPSRPVDTTDAALAELRRSARSIDCVVSAQSLPESTGLSLLRELRDSGEQVPFLFAPLEGSETLARDALAAGATDYASLGNVEKETLQERLTDVAVRETTRREEDDPRFEALMTDPDRFVAVLGAEGVVKRVSQGARTYLDGLEGSIVGKRLWALPWAAHDTSRRDVQRSVRTAGDGSYTDFEATLACGDEEHHLEFRLRPILDENDVVRLLVDATELTERTRLEAELRESEELHRVTLNNMTDTVLVTDDDGAFTYVCPNVHFIFGYTAEEIYDLGSIDALLGEDVVDRNRLESEGVLTNVECTVTDKEGREHTLLVNVREVSIQGGTTLYSCRDVTKRKQREEALAQLHRTSRALLYAETKPEIANQIADDAEAVLPSGGAAIYQFDHDANVLYSTAVSSSAHRLFGTLPEYSLDQRSCVSRAFVDEQTTRPASGDRRDADGSALSSFGDCIAVPLGDHGALLAGASDANAFDGVGEEVTELLAATTEAAFDRIERESELRDRDEALQQQNRRLSELNQVNEMIREIDQALVNAETRTEIETAVCERLTTDERFSFAWIGETTTIDHSLQQRAWAGEGEEYLDSVSLATDGENAEPSARTTDSRNATLVSNVAEHLRGAAWCKEAISRNFHSVLSIPLVYDDVLFGALTVYADDSDAFDDTVQAVLEELGDTIAAAINAVERKEALHSDAVVELDYRITDPNSVLFRLAAETDCTIEVDGEVTREDGTTLVFATVTGAPIDAVVTRASGLVGISDAEPVRTTDDGGFVSLETSDRFVTSILADHGATRRHLRATPDHLRLVVDVPDSVTTRTINEVVSNTFDGVDLLAQRERSRSFDAGETRDRFEELLTDRQREVARVAYHGGFFDADRDVTGRDIASVLDISHTAFYDHIRRIQRKFFSTLFENRTLSADVS